MRTTYEKEGRIAWEISTHVQERKTKPIGRI
jgi:hypothetical protein